MTTYIGVFLSLLAGVFLGILIACLVLKYLDNLKLKRKKIKVKKHKKSAEQYEIDYSLDENMDDDISEIDKDKSSSLLRQKLDRDDVSMDEFNCAADGVDYKEHLNSMRKREEAAYKITRH